MIISSKKYACETCIKGHRSSSCKHTDRPLFEIKKKGRPITQCEHCRELRKTKQVHVKCICEAKFDATQQGPQLGFDRAAFPNGLPPALGTSVAFPNPADGTSSDSDHGGVFHSQHCKSGDPCNCVTPRFRPSEGSSDPDRGSSRRTNPGHSSSSKGSTSHQILARIQELRPLVPRPPVQPSGGPLHDPSLAIPHGHPSSRHHGPSTPYGRAYGMPAHSSIHPQSYPLPPGTSPYPYNDQPYSNNTSFPPMGMWGAGFDAVGLPSLCGCGDDCACPGCIHHNRGAGGLASSSAYASCNNPNFCGTCMDCTIMALPSSAMLPPNTAMSIYDSSDAIDDWLRQMSTSNTTSSFQPGNAQVFPDFQQQQQPSWPTRGFPYADGGNDGRNSLSNYNGFSADDALMPFDPSQTQGKRGEYHHRQLSQTSVSDEQHRNIDPRLLPPSSGHQHRASRSGSTAMMGNHRQFLDVPFPAPGSGSDASRSRSPSTSSQSSHGHPSLGVDASSSAPAYRPSGRVQGMFDGTSHGHGSHANGHPLRAAPPLNMDVRPSALTRGPSSGSPSSGGGSGSGRSAGGLSAGGSSSAHSAGPGRGRQRSYGHEQGGSAASAGAGGAQEGVGEYGPSLAGLHIY